MSIVTPLHRRRLVSRLLALLPFAAVAPLRATAQSRAPLAATPRDAEGPFYPRRIPAEADFDLTRVAGRAARAEGTPLALSGRVLSTGGAPLGGARVELWQCDAHGHYHHVGGEPGDANFQGYGVVTTDAEGRFAFRTIRPVPYASRPPHLHFKLAHGSAQPLTTQLYPRGESGERAMGFGLSGREERGRLEFAMTPGQDPGTLAATYDFVLRPA